MSDIEFWLRLIPSAALTGILTLLALYFVKRALERPKESPAVWGATSATTAIAMLSALQTLGLTTGEVPEAWAQAALRSIAVAGTVQFWWFYRQVTLTDRKKAHAKGT